jgi:hypothetical protein
LKWRPTVPPRDAAERSCGAAPRAAPSTHLAVVAASPSCPAPRAPSPAPSYPIQSPFRRGSAVSARSRSVKVSQTSQARAVTHPPGVSRLNQPNQARPCRPAPRTRDPEPKTQKEGQTRSRSVKVSQTSQARAVTHPPGVSRLNQPNQARPCRPAPRTRDPKRGSNPVKVSQGVSRRTTGGHGRSDFNGYLPLNELMKWEFGWRRGEREGTNTSALIPVSAFGSGGWRRRVRGLG